RDRGGGRGGEQPAHQCRGFERGRGEDHPRTLPQARGTGESRGRDYLLSHNRGGRSGPRPEEGRTARAAIPQAAQGGERRGEKAGGLMRRTAGLNRTAPVASSRQASGRAASCPAP